ncbi:MAG: DUF3857 domain-containing protein [Thermoanaerobaculia bacterium]
MRRGPALLAGLVLVGLLPSAAAAAPAARAPRFGPPPRWAEPLAVPSSGTGGADAANGIVQLLLDHQMNPAEGALFVHDARRLTNPSGVQRGSQLSFSWDPTFETLTLHSVSVLRGDRRIDALRRGRVKVLERETEMDWHLYDGSLTAVLVLEDVRAGDVVEYVYTRRGENPIFGGRYLDGLGVRGSTPWAHVRYRLLWPRGRVLSTKAHGEVPAPAVTEKGPVTEYVWEARDVPALLSDSDLPSWFDPYPWVQLSEFASWRDVAIWAVPLYAVKDPGDAVRAEARRIRESEATPRERVAAALRFVQDEVRYLGLEMGTGSYRPNPPRDVLARRFGDCKDKALLFLALLRELGVEARPALVHTGTRRELDAWHPSPIAFNHVIVRVSLDGRELWLDPTRTRQGGALEETWLPPLDRALVVDPSTEGLATIPDRVPGGPLVKVVEDWTVPDFRAPASLVVTTTHRGPSADAARARLAGSSRESVEKGSLEFYTERYPGISQASPIATTDDRVANVVEIRESYSVRGVFAPRAGSRVLVASFYPQEIRDALPDPGSRKRTMPLELAFPDHVVHEATLRLPVDWPMTPHEEKVETSSFRFHAAASSSGRVVRLRYEWKTLADAVAAADAPEVLAKVSKIVDGLGWELTHDPDAASRKPPSGLSDVNIPAVAAALLFLGVCTAIAVRAARWRFAAPPVLPPEADVPLAGLGGWLVLFGFGCVVRPFVIAAEMATSSSAIFRTSTWNSLTSPGGGSYHPAWAPLLLGELFANVVLLVFSVLLVAVFFGKKRSFPVLAAAFLALVFAVVTADAAAARLLPETARQDDGSAAADAARAGIAALIWIPYVLRSRRVRATFLR